MSLSSKTTRSPGIREMADAPDVTANDILPQITRMQQSNLKTGTPKTACDADGHLNL